MRQINVISLTEVQRRKEGRRKERRREEKRGEEKKREEKRREVVDYPLCRYDTRSDPIRSARLVR